MWTKTFEVKFKRKHYDVLVWLSGESDGRVDVTIQSMANEYFLMEKITFDDRDSAYDFIKHYPASMAKAFLIRQGYDTQAFT